MIGWVDAAAEADALLREMHGRHLMALDDAGDVRMMLPFSARPADHAVRGESVSWWANGAWNSLTIPIAFDVDVEIDATWIDTGEPVALSVPTGELSSSDGFTEWRTPTHRWWDDIVDTSANIRFLRSEDAAAPTGAIAPLDVVWRLSRDWHGDRLDPRTVRRASTTSRPC